MRGPPCLAKEEKGEDRSRREETLPADGWLGKERGEGKGTEENRYHKCNFFFTQRMGLSSILLANIVV